MKGKIKHTLWIDSISLSKIDGKEFVPTKLYYDKAEKRALFGNQVQDNEHINENFKIDLGNITPSSITAKKTYKTAAGEEVNARKLTKDFLDNILYDIERSNVKKDPETGKLPIKIIMAEPLSFQVKEYSTSWITNYRSNIRKILSRYEVVDFLPEPFAVYQFYRYGLRIPQLSDEAKHIALIIDFGGGTFDACVIESTKEGDVSIKGRHSKPLAADSEPAGGFYINQQIAEYLIFRDLDNKEDQTHASKAIKLFNRLRKGDKDIDFDSLNIKNRCFIKNFEHLLASIENYKVELTNKINDWSIDSTNNNYVRVSIKLPKDPFSESEWYEGEFFCHEFRRVYISKVWNIKISKVIKRILKISQDTLGKRNITTTLLSGGSSNIRWLGKLLSRDFEDTFKYARPVSVSSSFQEIVAKGLAIECARRYYDESSEFVSVTYNPIKLILNPDDKGNEEKKFTSIKNKIDMEGTKPGDIMPSAQALLNFIDHPIQWKVSLSSAPRKSLKFYFTKSEDIKSDYDCYNVENSVVYTKNNRNIGSSIRVELTLAKDGTVYPRFIYKTAYKKGKINIPENAIEARPFAIDMTSDTLADKKLNKYIGIDFGTSNSSICELTNKQIDIIEHRVSESSWVEIKESLCDLPYPVAHSVRKYLDVKNADSSVAIGREAFEAILSFAAYTAAAEVMAHGLTNKALQNFKHRSLGPLRELLEKNIKQLGTEALFSAGFKPFVGEYSNDLSKAISEFTDHKHDKLDDNKVDVHRHLKLAVNICRDAMKDQLFGFCYSVNKVRFKKDYEGLFKLAHDEQFFTDTLRYEGAYSFSDDQALIFNKKYEKALILTPLIVWFNIGDENRPYSCSLFDKYLPQNDANLKPCDKKKGQKVSEESIALKDIYSELKNTGSCCVSEIISINIKNIST